MFYLPTSFIASWGAWAVFASVLITQSGAPVPAAPILILAGTLVASHLVSFWHVLAAAILGAIIPDFIWFSIGRRYGRRVMGNLVRISLSIDSSVRRARGMFERFGAPILSVSKFVPGLGLIAPPLLGTTRIDVRLFVLWDITGVVAWASFWVLGGAALQEDIRWLIGVIRAQGGTMFQVLLAMAVAYFLYRVVMRWHFRRWLAHIRISPEQLDDMMRDQPAPIILDARPQSVREAEPRRIPGAMLLDLESPEQIDEVLRESEVVVYCVCPNEATAKLISKQMRRKGFTRVKALKGGLDEWERRGYPIEPLPLDAGPASALDDAPLHLPSGGDAAVTVRAVAPN
ncbi:MAG: DedA family protein/thiosulfate sulfurtransferase GlpE [Janthinobacterium lividum]